jgi:23S rRNA (uracil1939-C5)-methyltransferase
VYEVKKIRAFDQFVNTTHVETVVILSQQKPDDRIEVEIELDELDLTSAESKATYAEIKDYVLKEHGLKVSSLYISQVKKKCGIEVGENYNLPKSENAKQPLCPEEKEKAIRDALEHFRMI